MAYEAPRNVLIPADHIQRRVRDLALEISHDYPDEAPLHFVSVLKGAFVFLGDLVRSMDRAVSLDFMAVSSYGKSTNSSGEVRLLKDLDSGLEGRHVIIVEDIVDTGLTLSFLVKTLRERSPRSLKVCVFLDKKMRRKVQYTADYTGFTIDDGFVVGYGLDCNEQDRALPEVYVVKE